MIIRHASFLWGRKVDSSLLSIGLSLHIWGFVNNNLIVFFKILNALILILIAYERLMSVGGRLIRISRVQDQLLVSGRLFLSYDRRGYRGIG
jgi:hypothetical protein